MYVLLFCINIIMSFLNCKVAEKYFVCFCITEQILAPQGNGVNTIPTFIVLIFDSFTKTDIVMQGISVQLNDSSFYFVFTHKRFQDQVIKTKYD